MLTSSRGFAVQNCCTANTVVSLACAQQTLPSGSKPCEPPRQHKNKHGMLSKQREAGRWQAEAPKAQGNPTPQPPTCPRCQLDCLSLRMAAAWSSLCFLPEKAVKAEVAPTLGFGTPMGCSELRPRSRGPLASASSAHRCRPESQGDRHDP